MTQRISRHPGWLAAVSAGEVGGVGWGAGNIPSPVSIFSTTRPYVTPSRSIRLLNKEDMDIWAKTLLELLKSLTSPTPAYPKTLGKLWTSSPSREPSRTRAPLRQAGFSNTPACAKRSDKIHKSLGGSCFACRQRKRRPRRPRHPRLYAPTRVRLAAVLPARARAGSVLAQLQATNESPLQQSVAMSGSLTT